MFFSCVIDLKEEKRREKRKSDDKREGAVVLVR